MKVSKHFVSMKLNFLFSLLKTILLPTSKQNSTAHSLGWRIKFSFSTLILALSTLLTGVNGWGQTTTSVGSGTSSLNLPFTTYYNHAATEVIYLASELNMGSSLISKIAFSRNDGNYSAAQNITDLKVYIKTTSSTTLSTGSYSLTGYTQVYNGAYTVANNGGWHDITFSSSFSYDGTSNLQVLILKSTPWSSPYVYWAGSTTASNLTRFYLNDPTIYSGSVSLTASTSRPNVRFTYTCNSPTTYYSKSTGNIDDLANWGTGSDGSGCNPANFTSAGITYIIQNNATPTTSASGWTVSGAGSLVKIGNNSASTTFTAGGTLSFDCNLEITGNATLSLGSNNMTLSGDLVRSASTAIFSQTNGSASTVTFSGSSQEVNVTSSNGTTPTDSDLTFNHVTISGSNVKLFYYKTNDRKLNINNFTVNNGAVVTLYSNPQ